MAEVLAEIYGVLGYNSCVLGMLLKDEEGNIIDGHAVTLVYVNEKWIIEDATFNVYFQDENNKCVGISELRENVGTGANILARGKTIQRKYISSDGRYSGIYDVYGEYKECNGYFYYSINTDVERYKEKNYESWKSVMENDGYEIEYESLFMYPALIYIPKSQKYNKYFVRDLCEDLIDELDIKNVVDFTTY